MGNDIPNELRGIRWFLREAAKTKAELKPDYAKFKLLAWTLTIYVGLESAKSGIQAQVKSVSQLEVDSRAQPKVNSSLAKEAYEEI